MSSASNTFKQRTRFQIVTMVKLKYVKQKARPSYKPSNLSQKNIEAAQKSDADAINQQQTNLSGVGGQYLLLLLKGVACKNRNTYERLAYNEINKRSNLLLHYLCDQVF